MLQLSMKWKCWYWAFNAQGPRLVIVTSGCPWPSTTVKSPGFFKLGSCFSFIRLIVQLGAVKIHAAAAAVEALRIKGRTGWWNSVYYQNWPKGRTGWWNSVYYQNWQKGRTEWWNSVYYQNWQKGRTGWWNSVYYQNWQKGRTWWWNLVYYQNWWFSEFHPLPPPKNANVLFCRFFCCCWVSLCLWWPNSVFWCCVFSYFTREKL